MRKRAFIIHGYQGFPGEAWLPWLKGELEKRGYDVSLPSMPSPDRPTIPEGIEFIAGMVGQPDPQTAMVGHSIGSQAIIRYLETLGAAGRSVGTTVLVASGFPSGISSDEARKMAEGDEVLVPWLAIGVDPHLVKKAAGRCTVILSDDDPFIDAGKARAAFQACLDAKIIMEHSKGHLNEDSGLTELPSALLAVAS
jgi:predicted alpha/beta hydrolase family esterase